MQPLLFALLLAALLLAAPVLSTAPLREEGPGQQRRSGRVRNVERHGAKEHFPLRLAGRRSDDTGAETTKFVSIFDLRRIRFFCKQYNREQHASGEARLACLFRDTWVNLGSQHDGQSWKPLPEDAAGLKANQGSHKLSSGRRRRLLLRPLVSRQRRGDPVNPSDPLRSESHPSKPGNERQEPGPEVSEQDQAGAESKETITSCDDPLKVLHSIRPVSPIKTNIAERAEQD